MNSEDILTIGLGDILKGIQVEWTDSHQNKPWLPTDVTKESFLVLEQRGLVRLSDETRRTEEERLAALYRKKRALRSRKPYTRKRGRVHPKKKAATRRRRLEKNWRDNPFGCLINGYGAHAIERALFDQHIAPLWTVYSPEELTIKKAKRDLKGRFYGTKENPYTIYSLTVVHKTEGVVFDGASLELYELSS